jgi:hypothetical protein
MNVPRKWLDKAFALVMSLAVAACLSRTVFFIYYAPLIIAGGQISGPAALALFIFAACADIFVGVLSFRLIFRHLSQAMEEFHS